MTFRHREFEACSLDILEGGSRVRNQVVSIVLGTLIILDNFFEVFAHKTRECGQCQT